MKRANQSKITSLLSQIEEEYLAATRGLTGFAATARHALITARMERIGMLHEQLRVVVGDEATRLLSERLESIPEE